MTKDMAFINHISVRARLFVLTGVLGVLLVALAITAITGFSSVKSSYNGSLAPATQQNYAFAANDGWLAQKNNINLYVALDSLAGSKRAAAMEAAWERVQQGGATVRTNLGALSRYSLSSQETALLHAAKAAWSAYAAQLADVHAAMRAGNTAQATALLSGLSGGDDTRTANAFSALGNQFGNVQTQIGDGVPNTTASRLTLMIALSIFAILLGVVLTFLIIRSITGPLREVTRASDRVADGDVDVEINVGGSDEISKVASSFRSVVTHIGEMSDAAREFAEGRLNVPLHPKSDVDRLGHSFVELQGQISAALGENSKARELESGMGELVDTLQRLEYGLMAMRSGDLTIEVSSELRQIEAGTPGESLGFVADRYNQMLASAESSLEAYNAMREELRAKLGDNSSLEALSAGMESLTSNCLARLQSAMQAMNDGNLTVDVVADENSIETDPGKELGQLAEVFNSMLRQTQDAVANYNGMRSKITAMLNEISLNSESLTVASSQMASTSEEAGRAIAEIAQAVGAVAQGAEDQVRSVEETRRLTDQLAESSRVSAEIADETAAAAEEARSLAREGVGTASEAAKSMAAVRDSSAEVNQAIRELGEKSGQIGGIVETITGIASQTNLLALNAAIEAARAGEHGRGFAVVAEEVRHLAEESQAAAATIGGLIDDIQQVTSRVVDVVEVGASQTHDGVETVERARDAFVQIGRAVDDVSARVGKIAGSIREIAESGDQMRESMTSVATVAEGSSAATQEVSASTEQSSASTQQIAASAQQLATTASELDRLVGQFVLS
jgi:methyl-accepting chemotaxis protein